MDNRNLTDGHLEHENQKMHTLHKSIQISIDKIMDEKGPIISTELVQQLQKDLLDEEKLVSEENKKVVKSM